MENNYIVYQHFNPINNKSYIGITKHGRNPNMRWKGGHGYEQNKKFFEDILKYGWDNFEHNILYTDLTLLEAQKKEEELISKFNTVETGYNNSPGWQALTPESALKISKSITGIKRKPESIQKQIETKIKNSGYKSGINPLEDPKAKKVQCKETLDVFCSEAEAGNWCGSSKISACCLGKRAHAGRHPETNELLSWQFVDNDTPITIRCETRIIPKKHNVYAVQCIETQQIFKNASQAAKETGITTSNILKVCHGERKTAGKYHWQFIKEE